MTLEETLLQLESLGNDNTANLPIVVAPSPPLAVLQPPRHPIALLYGLLRWR